MIETWLYGLDVHLSMDTPHYRCAGPRAKEFQDMALCRVGFGGVEWASTQMGAWPLAVLGRAEKVSASSYTMFLHRTWRSTRYLHSTRSFTYLKYAD